MNLSGIPSTEEKFSFHFLQDFVRGRISTNSFEETYDAILHGETYLSDADHAGVSYVWWQFCLDCGEVSREIIVTDQQREKHQRHCLIEEEDYLFSAIMPEGYDALAHMMQMGLPLYCPVLARFKPQFGTDYYGEGWEDISAFSLYISEYCGMHYFPISVFDQKPNQTTRIIMR